jgi:D-serine deaminase-like pyridoxal phosphate-dependent protein
MTSLQTLETPALVLDRARLTSNIVAMRGRLARLGVSLRPHVKTCKSIDVVKLALDGQPGGITVSTLREAEYFFAQGIADILYAVGIAPVKLPHVIDLIRRGARLVVILDSLEAARSLAAAAKHSGVTIGVLIEIDTDGHRAGIAPESELLLELGALLAAAPGVELRGVMTHAGESYNCRSVEAIADMAEQERALSVRAAMRLRAAGHAAPVVSVGSTPTATFARQLAGVTDVRAGVYLFQDLVMAGLDVCSVDDIALSVLVSVIGHQAEKAWIITDGGWMAMSRDHGTENQRMDQGYGLVRDLSGNATPDDLTVISTNQEHGIVAARGAAPLDLSRYPVGTLLRILPNHACATAAQFPGYQVVDGRAPAIVAEWPRINGWS